MIGIIFMNFDKVCGERSLKLDPSTRCIHDAIIAEQHTELSKKIITGINCIVAGAAK